MRGQQAPREKPREGAPAFLTYMWHSWRARVERDSVAAVSPRHSTVDILTRSNRC